MDAARLGMRGALPQAFLETAAAGYLTDTEWDMLPGDWLKEALDDTAKPAKGVRGPLTALRPRPGVQANSGDGPAWRLADYLDQHGRRARREEIPPASFWEAAVSCAGPADQTALAHAAEDRGLFRDAARLYKQASTHDHPKARASLVILLHTLNPGDQRPADWAAAYADLGDPDGVALLLNRLDEVGADEQVTALLARDPAIHASLNDPLGVAALLRLLRRLGADDQVSALLARDPATHVSLGDPFCVAWLLGELPGVGADEQITALAARAATHTDLGDPADVAGLLAELREVGADEQVTALAIRLPSAGMFKLFLKQTGARDRFGFGREADGTPATPWNWDNLGLSTAAQVGQEAGTGSPRTWRAEQ